MAESTPIKPEITKVASLTSDSFGERWKISVKVKNKSEKSCSKNGVDYFKVVLEDDSGQIEALAFGSQNLHRFFDKFEENKVYLISDGKLTKVNENFPNVGHPFQIHLESGTIVTCDDGENQPSSPFTPIAQLKKSNKTVVDVVGIVTGVWKLEKKYTDYRSINLTDENGFDVNVAFWGKLAIVFDLKTIGSVVSLKNVRVMKENGEVELQTTPNTELDYKPPDAEAVVLREILGIAEDNDEAKESDDIKNLDDDGSHCSGCHRRRGVSHSNRKRNDSGTSSGKGKCNKNNLANGAVCRRRGSGSACGKRGRKKYSRIGRGRGRRKSDPTCSPGCYDDNYDYDDVPNEYNNDDGFINDEAESDVEDSEVDDLREYKRKRLPVRHCKSLYSDFKEDSGTRKSTTSVADDDDDDSEEDDDDDDDDDDDSEDDKKDSDEKSIKKNQKKGRHCKRRLYKDQKDGKTSPGKLTKLRKKSTPDSGKKDGACSSKGPATKIYIQTDEESDIDGDNIKPVSSAKKVRQVESSDGEDTDSTVSYSPSQSPSATPSSSGKRKSCRSDDDDDDGNDKSDDDDDEDDEKDLTESAKKKFKRIKTTCTSSQETEQSVEPDDQEGVDGENVDEEGDNSGSDTDRYNSEPENSDDDQWVEEDQPDRTSIRQLREIQKDDDGTLYLLRHYLLWFAMKAGGETCEGEDFRETIDSKTKLEGRLEVVMNICQSQAWGVNFREDVRAYPKFVNDVKHDDLAGGDMRHLGNCQVCNRENHPWKFIVRLEGEPYNRETYEMVDKEEGEDSVDFPPVQYYMGCFCHPRTKLFHHLFHFGYNLYHRCKEMLEDEERSIDTVATDKSLLNEMYTRLKKWMLEAENDYTEDGERANKRWNREYNGEYSNQKQKGGNWLRFNF